MFGKAPLHAYYFQVVDAGIDGALGSLLPGPLHRFYDSKGFLVLSHIYMYAYRGSVGTHGDIDPIVRYKTEKNGN